MEDYEEALSELEKKGLISQNQNELLSVNRGKLCFYDGNLFGFYFRFIDLKKIFLALIKSGVNSDILETPLRSTDTTYWVFSNYNQWGYEIKNVKLGDFY